MKFRIEDGMTVFDEEVEFKALSVLVKIFPGSKEKEGLETVTNIELSPELKELTPSMQAAVLDITFTHIIKMTYLTYLQNGGTHEEYVEEIYDYTEELAEMVENQKFNSLESNKNKELAKVIDINERRNKDIEQ